MPLLEGKITLKGSGQFEGSVSSGSVVTIDASGLGGGEGIRPMELFLISVAACSGVSMIVTLKKKRLQITDFVINVKGEKSVTPPTVFSGIAMEYVIKGKNIPEKAVQHAVKLTKRNCSVLAMLKPSVQIIMSHKIIEE
ncbi:MAG: OsmC family protein [Nitrospirae bacterium]|nr:OsmC family protein [Nitrospirota bacterium]